MSGFESISSTEANQRRTLSFWESLRQTASQIDGVKLPTPSALLLAWVALNPEAAEAIEVPPNATYEEGIRLLKESAHHETHETQATFFKFSDDTTLWLSQEGEKMQETDTGVNVTVSYEDMFKTVPWGEHEGKTAEVEFWHTHPEETIRMMLQNSKSERIVEGSENISFPPSNGFMSDSMGDTKIKTKKSIDAFLVEPAKEKYNIDLKVRHKLYDTFGTWEWRNMNEEEWAVVNPDFTELYKTFNENHEKGISDLGVSMGTLIAADKIQGELNEHIDTWVIASQLMSAQELKNSDIYKLLVAAYAATGVEVSFEPEK